MQLFWATDIHLNFLSGDENLILLKGICKKIPAGDALVITGDIAEAPSVGIHMENWKKTLEAKGIKFYFVCGNHDFYHGSIKSVREELTEVLPGNWLGSAGVVKLTETTSLIGHDGWYDGLYDNWFKSRVDMNDYYCITELGPVFCAKREEKFRKIQELAQEAGDHVYKHGVQAFADPACEELYIATHVPPWREAAVHMGKPSDPDWMPHFSSKRMGDAILDLAKKYPDKKITVLCGHTHSQGVCNPASNVVCYTGYAKYHYPNLGKTFIIK